MPIRLPDLSLEDTKIDASQIGRLQKMIVDDLRPVRPILPSWAFFAAFALIFVALGALGVSYLGAYGWSVLRIGQKVAVFLTLAASAASLAFSLVRQMVPGHKSLLRRGLLPVALLVLFCLVVASVFQMRQDPHFLQSGEGCLRAGAPYGVAAALAFWFILGRGTILSPRLAGAMTGMLAGLVSTTVLEVYCPSLNLWHILVWHFGIALLGAITGLLIAVAGESIRNGLL